MHRVWTFWGKTAGYRSFYFMNFAAFKYLATALYTHRLDRACASRACLHGVSMPPELRSSLQLVRLLVAPIPDSSAPGLVKSWQQLAGRLSETLAGRETITGQALVPGVEGMFPKELSVVDEMFR